MVNARLNLNSIWFNYNPLSSKKCVRPHFKKWEIFTKNETVIRQSINKCPFYWRVPYFMLFGFVILQKTLRFEFHVQYVAEKCKVKLFPQFVVSREENLQSVTTEEWWWCFKVDALLDTFFKSWNGVSSISSFPPNRKNNGWRKNDITKLRTAATWFVKDFSGRMWGVGTKP